ncbi:MAG TPA: hypothetical protein VJX91_00385 [Candidatus Eisenbacteria bacterium]|nr:hypothetical protein [Candidatus Eisenbacteria bacterium]
MRAVGAVGLVLLGTVLVAAQEQEAPTLYELLPADKEYPIARVCSTDEGLCALPLYHAPGAPCSCQRADGSWVAGVCTH